MIGCFERDSRKLARRPIERAGRFHELDGMMLQNIHRVRGGVRILQSRPVGIGRATDFFTVENSLEITRHCILGPSHRWMHSVTGATITILPNRGVNENSSRGILLSPSVRSPKRSAVARTSVGSLNPVERLTAPLFPSLTVSETVVVPPGSTVFRLIG